MYVPASVHLSSINIIAHDSAPKTDLEPLNPYNLRQLMPFI